MRIAILYYPQAKPELLVACSKALAEGLMGMGHQVDIFNIQNEPNLRLGIYAYLCVGTQGRNGFSRKIDLRLGKLLAGLSASSGKRSFAFTTKQLFFADTLLVNLMKSMEEQGMFIRNSAVFQNPGQAKQAGLTLEVAKRVQ